MATQSGKLQCTTPASVIGRDIALDWESHSAAVGLEQRERTSA